MNIPELLEKRVKLSPDKPAFIFKDEAVTFLNLKNNVFKLADSLQKLGVNSGDKVALYLPNWPEYVYSYLAIWSLGAIAVPLDFMLTEDELIPCLTHCEAKVLIAKAKATIQLQKIKASCPLLKNLITCHEQKEGCLSFEDLLAQAQPVKPALKINDSDYAIIFYTSGTTGKPKGVLINYKQLGAPPQSMDFFVGGIKETDVALCALPFSHLGGLIYIQNSIVYGLSVILMERFIPVEFLRNIHQYRVSCFWIVPSMYYAFLQLKEFETFDLSSLRWIVSFGASNSPEALRRFHRYCPNAHLLNGWGLTETNAPTVVLPMGSNKIESVGRSAPWIEVKIFDDQGNEAGVGEVGEIVVKSWVVTDGYYKDDALTQEVIRDNWFYTGDLGRFDKEGHLYIIGRKKEMIKVGGEIVFEPEVEEVLQKHPDIAEAAVIGIADTLRGEVPKAFVSLKEGRALSEEELRYFCRQHLAHYKIPHFFKFKTALPKNRTGKIDKELLRKDSL
ncbi:MAG: AMP-binding protein [Candidatus Omnitrophica bacterium]|nr:AMP-binding protein [Candidatus Omnitrophota bacterium]